MKKLTISCLMMVMLYGLAFAQTPNIEYGTESELKGVKSIYIYTGSELELRNNILKEIQKKLKDITIASKAEEADVCLVFTADTATFFAGLSNHGTVTDYGTGQATVQSTSTPQYRRIIYGSGLVVKVQTDGTTRLLMDFKDNRKNIFERRPSTNFARAFVKAYEKANKD